MTVLRLTVGRSYDPSSSRQFFSAQDAGDTVYVGPYDQAEVQAQDPPPANSVVYYNISQSVLTGFNFGDTTPVSIDDAGFSFDSSGNTGTVRFIGGRFGDELRGGSTADSLTGAGGNDILVGGAGGDTLAGGAGIDTVSYENSGSGVTVLLGVLVSMGDAEGDSLSGIENLRGSAFFDILTGDTGNNVIEGGGGNDILSGGGGGFDTVSYEHSAQGVTVNLATNQNSGGDAEGDSIAGIQNIRGSGSGDNLTGNGSANTINGGDGLDTMTGGAGDDLYFVDRTDDRVIETNGTVDGTDTIFAAADYTLLDTQAIEVLQANAGTSGLALTGNGSDNSVIGGRGVDELDGAGGNDRLIGDGGVDTLMGGAGNDSLNGGVAIDDMTGGTGNDLYYVDDAGDEVHEAAGEGNDTVLASVDYRLAAGEQVETLRATVDKGLTLTGNALNNNLIGNIGADTLVGAAGRDTLTGGGGADSFTFVAVSNSRASAYDTIVDFSSAQGDRIDLSAIATRRMDGAFVFNDGPAEFSGQAGELIAVQQTGYVLVQGDTDGNGVADIAIRVNGTPDLQAGDFVL